MKFQQWLTAPVAAVAFSVPAHGFNMDNFRVATDLGALLAAEAFCDLSFDHDAIEAYIDAEVDHTDMGFASSLSGQTSVAQLTQRDMSESARRAHCRAIASTARQHGFID